MKFAIPAILSLLMATALSGGASASIPYPEGLATATIRVPRLDSIHEYALIVGNGDINALVYQEGDKLVLRITKNDVWDARLITKDDAPLPTLARLKELGQSGDWKNKGRIVPKGYKDVNSDSYHKYAYPCPRACAVVEITLPVDGSTSGGPVAAPGLSARLDLRRACAEVFDGRSERPIATVRALAQQNAFLISTQCDARLKPIRPDDLPEATEGKEGATTWVHQAIPGDPDWPGMEFAVALGQNDDQKAITVVSSRESQAGTCRCRRTGSKRRSPCRRRI